MMDDLSDQAWLKDSKTIRIIEALSHEVRFVGGCVRDALLGLPVLDIDMATPHYPEEVIRLLELKQIKVIPTGLKHGTVTAIIDQQSFEITTLRKDVDCLGRHAVVEYTSSWQDDASRRDFTMNALYCDSQGKIYDYYDGQKDLELGLVRFVGDAKQRCREDYLRILRFFRFLASYGKGVPDPEAIQACSDEAHGMNDLSGERISIELFKLLSSPDPMSAINLMASHGVLTYVLGDIQWQPDRLQTLITHERTYGLLVNSKLRLAHLLASVSSMDKLKSLTQRLRLSNADTRYLERLLSECPESLDDLNLVNHQPKIRALGKEIYHDVLCLAWSGVPQISGDEMMGLLDAIEAWDIPDFPLAGQDLLDYGFQTGKPMGKMLTRAQQYWEEKQYAPTKEELIKYILLINKERDD